MRDLACAMLGLVDLARPGEEPPGTFSLRAGFGEISSVYAPIEVSMRDRHSSPVFVSPLDGGDEAIVPFRSRAAADLLRPAVRPWHGHGAELMSLYLRELALSEWRRLTATDLPAPPTKLVVDLCQAVIRRNADAILDTRGGRAFFDEFFVLTFPSGRQGAAPAISSSIVDLPEGSLTHRTIVRAFDPRWCRIVSKVRWMVRVDRRATSGHAELAEDAALEDLVAAAACGGDATQASSAE